MSRRLELHQLLVTTLGSRNVYYQPPSTVHMKYPCILYNRSRLDARYADNNIYTERDRYSLTIIDSDPDSEIIDKVRKLPYCQFDRHFTSENLNHDVFNIYY